jgi:hypothetical protein
MQMSLRVGQTSGERETEMKLPLCGIGRVARQSKSKQNGEAGVDPEERGPQLSAELFYQQCI